MVLKCNSFNHSIFILPQKDSMGHCRSSFPCGTCCNDSHMPSAILASAVAVNERVVWLSPSPIGILQRTDLQILAHSCRHRQPDVVVPKKVVDGCHIKPPFIGTDIGDVRNQLFIRPLGLEIPVQQVLRDGKIVVALYFFTVFERRSFSFMNLSTFLWLRATFL